MSLSPRAHVLDNPAKKERRSWNRIPVQIQVFCQRVQGEDELYWSARVTDISRGGIGLLSPHKFELGTIIQISKADGARSILPAPASVGRPGSKLTRKKMDLRLRLYQGIERIRVSRLG